MHWLLLPVLMAVLGWGGMMQTARATEYPPHRIVGYFTSWGIYGRQFFVTDLPADRLTHINYAFANFTEDGEVIPGDRWADMQVPSAGERAGGDGLGNFNQLRLLRTQHPHLRTLISLGGWNWSALFSPVAADPVTRARFAESAVTFMLAHGFDGIDIDWEYPGAPGHPLNRRRDDDPQNFILLLQALRDRLNAQRIADARPADDPYLLTIAVGAGQAAIDPVDWVQVAPLVDWINVMAYDMAGGWAETTGHNAPLYPAPAADPPLSAHTAMQSYVTAGVPARQLVLGTAFYGRGFAGVPPTNNGLYQPFEGLPPGTWENGVFDYHDLAANYLPRFGQHWADAEAVPYLYDPTSQVMITYDDPRSLGLKANYVRDGGFGGVMIWEMSGDTRDHVLIDALYAGLYGLVEN